MIQNLIEEDFQKGLVVFAPFYIAVSTFSMGLSVGLINLTLLLLLTPIVYFLRNFFVNPQQRIAFVLIINVFLILIIRMLLNAEAFSLIEKTGLFLPLLLINSFILASGLSVMSMTGLHAAIKLMLKTGLIVLVFFTLLGSLRELLSEVIIFNSPTGYFFVFGFLYAAYNFLVRRVYQV